MLGTLNPLGRFPILTLVFTQPLVCPCLISHNTTDDSLVSRLRAKLDDIPIVSWRWYQKLKKTGESLSIFSMALASGGKKIKLQLRYNFEKLWKIASWLLPSLSPAINVLTVVLFHLPYLTPKCSVLWERKLQNCLWENPWVLPFYMHDLTYKR